MTAVQTSRSIWGREFFRKILASPPGKWEKQLRECYDECLKKNPSIAQFQSLLGPSTLSCPVIYGSDLWGMRLSCEGCCWNWQKHSIWWFREVRSTKLLQTNIQLGGPGLFKLMKAYSDISPRINRGRPTAQQIYRFLEWWIYPSLDTALRYMQGVILLH